MFNLKRIYNPLYIILKFTGINNIRRDFYMYWIGERIYKKFSEDNVTIKIPKKLLLDLMRQVKRHNDILNLERELIDNLVIHEKIHNTEIILTKLFVLTADPYEREEIILFLTIAEFLVLRDIVFCNNSIIHLRTKINFSLLKAYKELFQQIENLYQLLNDDEVNAYRGYIKSN